MDTQDYSPPSSSSKTPSVSPSTTSARFDGHRQRFYLNHAQDLNSLNANAFGTAQLYRQVAKARPYRVLHHHHHHRKKLNGVGVGRTPLPESVCEFVCGHKRRLVIDIDLGDPRIQRRSWPNSVFQPRSHDECRWYVLSSLGFNSPRKQIRKINTIF